MSEIPFAFVEEEVVAIQVFSAHHGCSFREDY